MGEQKQPGEQEIMKWRASETDPNDDAEGHGIRIKAGEDTDTPPSEDAEGHSVRWGRNAPDTDEPPSDDAEGHATRYK
jgi:hypothetical protein